MPTRAQPPPARLPQMLFGMEVFLKSIIHDWDDERAATILGNCRRAMGPRGTPLLVERVMPEAGEASLDAALGDLQLLVGAGGRERTEAEFRALFARSGLTLTRVIPTATGFSVIEGRPARSG